MKEITQNTHKRLYLILFLITMNCTILFAQTFTEVVSTSFTATNDSTHAFADIDGDTP